MKAVLGLENGRYFFGEGFGAEGVTGGELVFTTQMTGYMEALTDPSYHGQILLFTYPLIGNYGVDKENFQNPRVWAGGCVVHELCRKPAQYQPLHSFFEEQGLLGISGIDTRNLTIGIREQGTIRAALLTGSDDHEAAVELAKKTPDITARSLIPDVSCKQYWHMPGTGPRIAVIDLGIKTNMLKSLSCRGGDLHIFPHNVKPDEILACRPDCLFISNGPGDPEQAVDTVKTVRELIGQLPVFGICMGNQICGLSLGARCEKMKFGHRGANQPVRHMDGTIAISSQNHGFVVDGETLPEGCEVTFVNCNDGTLEGFQDTSLDVHCVQFHPEAHAGPHDTEKHYFDRMFRRMN
ncbi:glutamine-hydrolyzing carbamoyl-phosphate synthase small subunit [Methanospirillum stamsii]|uniref:Carbamoyl phosphate synthase small chain n=1 Tax=Methanospirillum stamsii TaxID=1277351 RepID=A0A2V2N6V3_9EURY|nr:glutamine-hydrolyzing carbamoyl-phosphate synthase small subunit [Methanospirillum stamsii]PWR75804.1 carbamoyl phosphate synthase small subunit [Methanospirillum stamsii]